MNPTKIQLEFCEKHNITFDQFIGKTPIEGSLDLWDITEIPKQFNPTVSGYLDLDSVTELPKGFSPIVGGYLGLRLVEILPEGFSPIVGGTLNLNSVEILPEGFSPIVGGTLNLNSVEILPEGFSPTVGGLLDLDSVTELPKGFSPIVGGGLGLDSVTEISKGFNPTVGGHLGLDSVTEISKGFNPTVGWRVHIKDRTLNESEYTQKETNFFDFKNGYIQCDDIFMQVTSHKGNVWKGRRIASPYDLYLVSDGNSRYAHGKTLKEAKEDLIFKVDGRRPNDFEHLTAESVLSFEESIIAYRVITGACSYGVKDYIKNRLPSKQKEFRMSEVIELTKDEYGGNSFSNFINK